jgi:hypothetical protein
MMLNGLVGSNSLYLPYKMVYLLVLSGAVLGGYALAQFTDLVPNRPAVLKSAFAMVPLAVAVPLMWGRVPRRLVGAGTSAGRVHRLFFTPLAHQLLAAPRPPRQSQTLGANAERDV